MSVQCLKPETLAYQSGCGREFESPRSHMNELYFNPKTAAAFAAVEVNQKYAEVADIVDRLIEHELQCSKDPLFVAELGGGAHPSVYDRLFSRLITGDGRIDWVDYSPVMIDLARNNLPAARGCVTRFVCVDVLQYLSSLADSSLDLAIMKYTFDHVKDVEVFFRNLAVKLKSGGRLIATMTTISPLLRSCSRNVRYFYRGNEFPEGKTRLLEDGESFVIKFFRESGNPSSGYVDGADVTKFYHSREKIERLSKEFGLEVFLGLASQVIPVSSASEVLILRKHL